MGSDLAQASSLSIIPGYHVRGFDIAQGGNFALTASEEQTSEHGLMPSFQYFVWIAGFR